MVKTRIKCIQCDGEYVQERGKGAGAINTSHLCAKCLNPPKPEVKTNGKKPATDIHYKKE
jgi:hypothetical protein